MADWVSGQQMKQLIRQPEQLELKLGYLVTFVVVSTFSSFAVAVAVDTVAFYLLATVLVSLLLSLLLRYNNFDDGRYGTRRFGWAGLDWAPLLAGGLDGYRNC